MLSIASVEKTYRPTRFSFFPQPATEVLRGIDLQVRPGEILGVLGANGAGKTTLLHIVAGLAVPDRGLVMFEGQLLLGSRARNIIGICSSADRSFYYRLTMRQNLAFFAALHGLRGNTLTHRVDALLRTLSLDAVADRRYAECSSGMRQRLALARALLHDPPILLLDEPTRGLDPAATHEFHALLRGRCAGQQKTTVLATNVLDEAWSVCDRVALLAQGRILAIGPAAAMRERVECEFMRAAREISL